MEGSIETDDVIKTVGELIARLSLLDASLPLVVPGFDEVGYSHINSIDVIKIALKDGGWLFEFDKDENGYLAVRMR